MNLPRQWRWAGAVAVLAALTAAIVGVVGHLELHPDATNRLRDDAFYEFAWAANVAAGRGPVVSEGVTTSGVQLLWCLLLVPVVAVVGTAALPLVAAWLGFALHAATAALWYAGTRDRITGACLGLCWLGNPLLVRESQNGQETALACACLVAMWFVRRRRAAVFGAWALAVVLARSDLWVFVLVMSLWRDGWRSPRAFGVPLLTLAVHLGVNRLLGGGWLPDSALPMAWLWHANHELVVAGAPDGGGWLARMWWFTRPVLLGGPWALASAMGLGLAVFAAMRRSWPEPLRALPALVVGCASGLGAHDLATAGWAALLLALFPTRRLRRPPRGRLLLLCAAVAVVALHWAVRWYPRDYYVAPLVLVAMAALQPFGRWRLLLVLFAIAQIQGHQRIAPEPLRAQEEMVMAGRFLADVVPGTCGIGSFNSGLVTYYAAIAVDGGGERRRRLWNLDGVVDARAFAALRERRLTAWLDQEDVDFLLDNAVQFALDPRLPHAAGHWFGAGFAPDRDLVELARFDVPGVGQGRPGADSMRLYWRRGRDVEPPRPTLARDLGPAPRDGRYVLWPARAGEVLEAEGDGGQRVAVVAADVDTTVVVRVAQGLLATGRLFVRGHAAPLLTLSKL